ncbi:hypothetical protein N7509_013297 [Penicillium cosmopolitanum]|uniref:ABM domain-containing protein n=1 Tax=Penicillium cosmopolitanum TaxID=1131564 RepID=A0A9W9SD11_9EURO|nr:uncharacterized protein N7509_013297 [Penicillium cosmopolitanum]KAJ5376411.1 hypothetical protein N7509_013297 [Penicillium cosmopolitanum]
MAPIHKPLDRSTTFDAMLSVSPAVGPVVLLNIISLPQEQIRTPGYISTQLHGAIGDGNFIVNYAVWENNGDLKNALYHPEFREICEDFPDGTEFRACVLQKEAIPGVCVGL